MMKELERKFDAAMENVYVRALNEAGYRATAYHEMLVRHRGLETAKRLVNASSVSTGYTALWERKRLDLTVEALILESKWHVLFEAEELEKARKRLKDYGYDPQ
jgi:hypothetical protein